MKSLFDDNLQNVLNMEGRGYKGKKALTKFPLIVQLICGQLLPHVLFACILLFIPEQFTLKTQRALLERG